MMEHGMPQARPGHARVLGIAAALACGLGAAQALAQTPPLPALVTPPSAAHHVGKMVFGELVTPDLATAKRFYGALFGWTFQDAPSGTFTEASLDGAVVAGIAQRPLQPGRHPAWLAMFAATDVQQADAVASQQGGTVLFAPHPFANLGQEVVLADPQGAVFALLASSSGDPADTLAAPGQWIWSSLITSNPETDAAFYKTLLGYQVLGLPDAQDTHHLILASEDYARASVNPVPSAWGSAHPRWLSYVRVDDAQAMAARATSLGGHVLLAPRLDRHGGRIAIVADPQGAVFGLMEWSDDAPAGAAK